MNYCLVTQSVEQRWSNPEVVGLIPTQVRDFSLHLGERSWCCWPAKVPNLSITFTVVLGLIWFLPYIYTAKVPNLSITFTVVLGLIWFLPYIYTLLRTTLIWLILGLGRAYFVPNSHGLLPSGLVAQSVEQRWFNPEVVGSIPTQVRDFSLYLGERSWCCWPLKVPN